MSLGLLHNGNVLFQYYVQIMSIISIAAIWGMYDLLIKHDEKQPFGVAEWMSYTFFITQIPPRSGPGQPDRPPACRRSPHRRCSAGWQR